MSQAFYTIRIIVMHVHKVKAFYAVPEERQNNLKLKCED